MAVAELVGREAEQRPDDNPKVNINGIEEVVVDKGYHSGAIAQRIKSYEVRSYIPEHPALDGCVHHGCTLPKENR